jgi:TPP-dependent pyruvate/acetoin dehydrogenase alpha subunit
MNDKKLYKKMFKQALKIRLVEEDIISRYQSDKIQSPVHLSIGQEAVAVGVCESLGYEDLLFSTYRSHAFYLAKGGDLNKMMAELYGRIDGCCKGKGGSMHLAAPEVGFVGTSAIVASSIPNAVGAAMAGQMLGKKGLVVVVFGDGATEEGVYHESLNYAALHKIPVVFVCENNDYAVHSKISDRQSYSILEHAKVYGIETHQINDGADFVNIHNTFSQLCASVKIAPRPVLIEIPTCRYKEHVGPGEDFAGGYRSEEQLMAWKAKDALETDIELLAQYKDEVLAEIAVSVEFAENSPVPLEKDLYDHVI